MRRAAQLLAGIALLGGCRGEQTPTESTTHIQPHAAADETYADENKDLATLRRVTAPFHDFKTAVAAGWSVPITECMSDPAGGMGWHYGNPGLIDKSVRVEEPELLLYEPERNGRMRLVAVEYIVPLSAWTSPQPPRLFGRAFVDNQAFQIWALHVWVWKDNPRGLYADWNPQVTCEHPSATPPMSH